MVKKFKTFESRPIVFGQIDEAAIALSKDAVYSLYKKSQKSGITSSILEEVYRRGYSIWNESFGGNAEQFAFDRVNSFIAGGFAAALDEDLIDEKNNNVNNLSASELHKNHLKPNGWTIKNTTGSHDVYSHPQYKETIAVPRHKGNISPGVCRQIIKTVNSPPSLRESVKKENQTTNPELPSSRFIGSNSLVNILKNTTPGQSEVETTVELVKRVISSTKAH